MPTLKIRTLESLFIVPEFALIHAGFLPDHDGKKRGHTDPRMSTGSVFLPTLRDPKMLLSELFSEGATRTGPMIQRRMKEIMGWSALETHMEHPDALLIKEESIGEEMTRAVLVPAQVDPAFGGLQTKSTHELSAIAPATTDASMLPEDVANDSEVLTALTAGRLRTVASFFPGASIVDGIPVPRASAMAQEGLGFRVHPDNELSIPMPSHSAEEIRHVCQTFNQGIDIPFNKSSVLAALASMESGPLPIHSGGITLDTRKIATAAKLC